MDSPFKAKEGEPTCNSCIHFKRCAELNNSIEHLDGCRICKCYEINAGYGDDKQDVIEFAEQLLKEFKEQKHFYEVAKLAFKDVSIAAINYCIRITKRHIKCLKVLCGSGESGQIESSTASKPIGIKRLTQRKFKVRYKEPMHRKLQELEDQLEDGQLVDLHKIPKDKYAELQAVLERAYAHNAEECKWCMDKVEAKHKLQLDSVKAQIRKETAKEIIEIMKRVQAMFYDKEYVAIQNLIAEKYGVEVG